MKKTLIVCLLSSFLISSKNSRAQADRKQFWNEFSFTHPINAKWSNELNVGDTWTGVPSHNTFFASLGQVYVRDWIHFTPSDKWKVSAFLAYFYNRDVPELEKSKTPEWRYSVQATYYFHRERYTLNTRLRFEDRHIRSSDSIFEAVNRIRAQLKYIYPINKPVIEKNAIYLIASDELFFKNKSNISGPELFDRNRLTVGLGYALDDDFQLELTYANEWLPRKENDQLYNALQFNVVLTRFFHHFVESLPTLIRRPEGGDN
ncbi:DUF2490 domain-containing protein [Pedobacter sp. HMF7647]|uniref:DUF2490 domain-containing protein n=1 Tax=Hufsiella arboris TaxID=2695275 RepID=A0A7K1Y9Z1_9SPHI|nr:DUF2490 domain-containing protein [Hufsiella arboris]MXV51161.1 DUF2490 domain-containing protein [Hufsiella arboris]